MRQDVLLQTEKAKDGGIAAGTARHSCCKAKHGYEQYGTHPYKRPRNNGRTAPGYISGAAGDALEEAVIMLKEARFEQVYIVCGYTDMRRSIDGLAAIIQQNFGLEPCSGSLFLFCGKRRDRMKALLWEGDGFLLLYKRLDNGCFQWPRNGAEAKLLTHEQYIWLLQGLSVEQPKAIKTAPKRDVI